MTSWLITGAGGMLGHDLAALLRATGAEVETGATAARWISPTRPR